VLLHARNRPMLGETHCILLVITQQHASLSSATHPSIKLYAAAITTHLGLMLKPAHRSLLLTAKQSLASRKPLR